MTTAATSSSSSLATRGGPTVEQAELRYAHGTRARYNLAKCRCSECRRANTDYEIDRQAERRVTGPVKPDRQLIPAEKAVTHLKLLQSVGVKLNSVSRASGISRHLLERLVQGRIRRTRRSTTDRILAVGSRDGSYVDATETWKLLDDLIARGFTRIMLAQQLGLKSRGLQVNRVRVTTATARKISALYAQMSTCEPS
jgi:hypothetical protein